MGKNRRIYCVLNAKIIIKRKGEEAVVIKIGLLIVFFAVMLGIGFYTRKHATNVGGFVLGGRAVGPWLTAFA